MRDNGTGHDDSHHIGAKLDVEAQQKFEYLS